MSILTDIFSSGAKSLVDSVGNVLDNIITTKEEKQQLDNEILKSEMQFQIEMQKLSIDERRMVIEDTANARSREIQIQTSENATKLSKNIMPYIAIGTIIITLSLFYVLIFSPNVIKSDSKDIILYILGVLSAVLTQIYSYYFGSSAGSAAKDKTVANLTKT